ncbi:MAG TPA: hypothetical protein VLJ41_06670 [Segetibacter sp.]|nr:hypothetical protein [Segetibacter sp.]
MTKINRSTFLKQSFQIGALACLNPLGNSVFANWAEVFADDDLLKRLVSANDHVVTALLPAESTDKNNRRIGLDFALLSASYNSPGSNYYQSEVVLLKLQQLIKVLLSVQAEDGTVNVGNLESPPDTAFLLESLTAGAYLLSKNISANEVTVNELVKQFIIKAGDGLTTGGVHTPNHRWVVCAALARINVLFPNRKYTDRIEEWLGEGIFIDSDGHYPERSMNYAVVENNSLITMARLLNKPSLLEPVRRNLEMTYYYMEPNGDLVTTDSRRQDQYSSKSIVSFYLHYRYMAIHDGNSKFAGIAKAIEQMPGFEEEVLSKVLFQFLENSLLQKELPRSATPTINFEKLFTTSHLLRIRRNNTTTTLFGGVDWPIIIASGRSNSPNFFSYRKGKAILKYLRLSSSFFSMGYFYSEGLKKEGNKYILHKKLEVPYYQPLPKNLRKASGDYKLSPSIDNRFWNKMDFNHRPVSNVKTLETKVSLVETNGKNQLSFEVTGQAGVQVTIELCFKEGGKLSGVTAGNNGNSFFETGFGKYEFEGDVIEFGPGTVAHKTIAGLEGERYSTHFGNLRTEGMHVYLTGTTPFRHTLNFS